MPSSDLAVIFNPTAGKHRAAGRLEAIRASWGERATFFPTIRPGHAEELARQAAEVGFRIVAAAGGDGTFHEVANGLLAAGRADVQFGLVPIGSANDYAYSVRADSRADRAGVHLVDVGRVAAPDGRARHFVCNLGLGLNGAVTVESRRIGWLQGMLLYGAATLRALGRHYACPEMTFQLDDAPPWTAPTLSFSALLGKREGGFVLAPDARLDDGWLDYVHVGKLSRPRVLALLPRVALFGPPRAHPQIRLGQCKCVHLTSAVPLNVHVDGELFCTAAEGIRELAIEIQPHTLQVMILDGC